MDKLSVSTTDKECGFSCFPEAGGVLSDLHFFYEGQHLSVLESLTDLDSVLKDRRYINTLLFPFPNRLKDGKYTYEQIIFEFPINEKERNNALHGFLFHHPLEVVHTEETDDYALVKLQLAYRQHFEFYPFNIDIGISYKIEKGNVFSVSFDFENKDDKAVPFAFGWHPYFNLECDSIDEFELITTEVKSIEVDERLIPKPDQGDSYKMKGRTDVKELVIDQSFDYTERKATQEVQLLKKDSGLGIKLSIPELFKKLHIYTPPHRKSIAIEAVTHGINDFSNSNNVFLLKPNQSLSTQIKLALIHKD